MSMTEKRKVNRENMIHEARIEFIYKDDFGEAGKTFYNSRDARDFLERFTILREFLKNAK